ncbi:MAG TPA: hypothetical protein VH328_03165 [Burkholderiaceae bacterium]|jgi:hypothetical protein|nr:hypothetical protein [Burkholderiaceae bacterium]
MARMLPTALPMRFLACVGALALFTLPVAAMTTTYQCTGYRTLTAEFTPRDGQVHFEGQDYTLHRVADSHEATFVDGRHGVTVVMRQGELSLHLPKEQLACKLRSDALRDLGPASHPAP